MAKVKVTQLKSLIGRKKNHRLSVKGLGLKGIGDSKILERYTICARNDYSG